MESRPQHNIYAGLTLLIVLPYILLTLADEPEEMFQHKIFCVDLWLCLVT